MSPEISTAIAGLLTALVPTILLILRSINQFKTRQKQLENDSIQLGLEYKELKIETEKVKSDFAVQSEERDNRQRDIIDGFVLEFNEKNEAQAVKIEKLTEKLTEALIDKARLEGRLDELVRNQTDSRDKMIAYDKRISELEVDRAVKADTILRLTKENKHFEIDLLGALDELDTAKETISTLENKLIVTNGDGVEKVDTDGVTIPQKPQAHLKSVKTAKTADNEIVED